MTDRAWEWVPVAVRQYGDTRSRAHGSLDVTLGCVAGRTRITHAAYTSPLAIQRVQYRDALTPAMAVVPLLTVGGGVLGGDRLTLNIRAEAETRVHVTTVTATKLYRMPDGYAAQEITLTAAAGAVIEYLPAPLIAQRGTRYASRTCVIAAPGATVICGDLLIPGRIAMGERGAYDAISLITHGASAVDAEPVWRDALTIESTRLPGSAVLTVGTLFGITRARPAATLADALHAIYTSDPRLGAVQWGVSDLPDGSGVIVRIAGDDSRVVQEAHHAAWHHLRVVLLGVGAPPRL